MILVRYQTNCHYIISVHWAVKGYWANYRSAVITGLQACYFIPIMPAYINDLIAARNAAKSKTTKKFL